MKNKVALTPIFEFCAKILRRSHASFLLLVFLTGCLVPPAKFTDMADKTVYKKNRNGHYAGINVNGSNIRQGISCSNRQSGDCDPYFIGNSTRAEKGKFDVRNAGLGGYFGYNIALPYDCFSGNCFVAPELFYDYLNSSSTLYAHDSSAPSNNRKDSKIDFEHRYGAKMNIGYWLGDLGVFVNYGVANVGYKFKSYEASENMPGGKLQRYRDDTMSAVYGLGLKYYFNYRWSLKLSYDHQKVVTYFYSVRTQKEYKNKASIDVVRFGFDYNF
jgi:Outer membrane protein beta-barrel domain